MIREVELNLFVPSSELLVRLASGERPLGVKAGPPRIRVLRETYFDTPDQALRSRGMTCKLRQGEDEDPSVVVTVGEGPDSEGITSRSRLTASAVGLGLYETLKGDSEPALQIQKFVDPADLRPHIALDIQRLGRILRTRVLRRAILLLFFDRITVQVGRSSSVFHELRIRRRMKGGPLIRDLGQMLRDRYHLFPDGLSTLQRAHRILAMEGRTKDSDLSPYAMSLALALFREGDLGLVERNECLTLPTFRGSGEDAARALLADLAGSDDLELVRLGTTEPRKGQPSMEVWAGEAPPSEDGREAGKALAWHSWHDLLEDAGGCGYSDPNLLSALLLLTRRRLLGQLTWVPPGTSSGSGAPGIRRAPSPPPEGDEVSAEVRCVNELLPILRSVENRGAALEERLLGVGKLSRELSDLFSNEVRTIKERILSEDDRPGSPSSLPALDLISVRVRAITDRLYSVVGRDLLPSLEQRRVHLRAWSGLMHEDRRALLEEFTQKLLPSLKVVADWGPALVPEMPSCGCALGLSVRTKGSEATRFFHLVLGEETPSFIRVSGSTVVLPLEEVVRGYLFSRYPALERAETHLFRFKTVEVTVREAIPNPAFQPGGARSEGEPGTGSPGGVTGILEPSLGDGGDLAEPHPLFLPASPTVVSETRQSVVVRVLTHRSMPEVHQAQLVRALERQVARKSPLIGWSDIYPVSGPMDLSGLPGLLDLE